MGHNNRETPTAPPANCGLGHAKATRVRFHVLALGCSLSLLTYIHRQAFVRAMPEIKNDLDLNTEQMGYLAAAFLVAYGLSYVQDIERQEPREYESLLKECEALCGLAEQLACPMIQLLTDPLDPNGAYKGLAGKPWPEMRTLTAKNLRALGDIGKAHQVKFYLEALTFTPLNRLDQQLELLEETARENVGLVLDFYHLWDSGTRPEEIARIHKDFIFCVDFCDSLDRFGERGDIEQRGRDVWTGGGRIPLKEWVDAVKSTGFDGIWRCELLSPKYWQLDPWTTARDLKVFLEYMLV